MFSYRVQLEKQKAALLDDKTHENDQNAGAPAAKPAVAVLVATDSKRKEPIEVSHHPHIPIRRVPCKPPSFTDFLLSQVAASPVKTEVKIELDKDDKMKIEPEPTVSRRPTRDGSGSSRDTTEKDRKAAAEVKIEVCDHPPGLLHASRANFLV